MSIVLLFIYYSLPNKQRTRVKPEHRPRELIACKLATNVEIWKKAVVTFDSKNTYREPSQLSGEGALLGEAMNIMVSSMLCAAHWLCTRGKT